ncbi:hypothetical protein BO78DRAFT_171120 [Aspergillus sclerotiicarbonarius CBS 121057]|uniref:Hydrophobic surface binding protein A n=1 Tax=Aspergillus sclerotiicarbonarius (strain CBS 121057 / IBT 28362) TaxID=1448318 RepID=A0A319ED20_ASPSB|nr:hypothetical protein BO78DRAFT_171120 [Aspergillus sclerotiicarbonarius CBS 121057]
MRFPLVILTLLSTILISSLTLALPSPSTPNQLLPRTTETIPLITSLVKIGLNAIKLDKALRSFTPNDVDEIRTPSSDLEQSLDQAESTAKSTAKSTENLDARSSTVIAGICTPLKAIFGDMLNVISDKRSDLFAADYGDDMLQTLTNLKVRSRAVAQALKNITKELDGTYIVFLEDLVDRQFALVIEEYRMNKG